MEKLFTKLPITIQQAKKTKASNIKKEEYVFVVRKYNAKKHTRTNFYKPISKIVIV